MKGKVNDLTSLFVVISDPGNISTYFLLSIQSMSLNEVMTIIIAFFPDLQLSVAYNDRKIVLPFISKNAICSEFLFVYWYSCRMH